MKRIDRPEVIGIAKGGRPLSTLNATNDKRDNSKAYCSINFSLLVFLAFSRATVINNNIKVNNQGGPSPSIQIFVNQFKCLILREYHSICPKTCNLWPSFNLFVNLMQYMISNHLLHQL